MLNTIAMRIAVILLAAVVASSCAIDDTPVTQRIRATVEAAGTPDYAARDKNARQLWTSTQDFYKARDFAPVWLEQRRPTERMEALIAAINDAGRDGLDARLYDEIFTEPRSDNDKRKRVSVEDAAEIDIRLTLGYLQFASDLANGISNPAKSGDGWHVQPLTFDPAAHLTSALASGQIAESFDALRPNSREYRALGELLADYRTRASQGLTAAANSDGVSLADRIKQIELNMERWRWFPRDQPAKRIVVNIPAFRLDVWEADKVALTMRVVVGKKDTPTPIFTDNMTHLVFSPYWNVPPTIAKGETIPSALRDPSFLERTQMEVLDSKGRVVDPESIDFERASDYRFRQKPGSSNALGLVKFMFPNEFNVYLHDTPADSLFARTTRAFSHGCVRVEQPQALAEYLLKDRSEWTSESISAAMHAAEERTVKLREPVPVYIGYWTVDVAPDGQVAFANDVYGLDKPQGAALSERLAQARRPTNRIASTER